MKIEITVYEGFDDLDAFAPFELLAKVERAGGRLEVALVQLGDAPTVTSSHGAVLVGPRPLSREAADVDLVIVPGGGWLDASAPAGARAEVERGELPRALAALHASGVLMASVCTGALLLAAAGLLDGRPATTHPTAREDLRAAGARVLEARVVDDGDVVTAGGVTSGLDLALWLVERHVGARAAGKLERAVDFERRGVVWQRDPAETSR
ncbi:MAG: ThiJ/PfpI domain protein [Conexibacter sp.]|nr:ThiJ/PfpI domain protein [Conexibacter sp.]